jgi:hypothetical protein
MALVGLQAIAIKEFNFRPQSTKWDIVLAAIRIRHCNVDTRLGIDGDNAEKAR